MNKNPTVTTNSITVTASEINDTINAIEKKNPHFGKDQLVDAAYFELFGEYDENSFSNKRAYFDVVLLSYSI